MGGELEEAVYALRLRRILLACHFITLMRSEKFKLDMRSLNRTIAEFLMN